MKFGVRECCDVVFRAKSARAIGNKQFYKDEPVIYFDTLKTSTLEGAATTVYATGGRGNARLMAWEGERTLTFTMEDALISPEGIAILTGAGIIEAKTGKPIKVHATEEIPVATTGTGANGIGKVTVTGEGAAATVAFATIPFAAGDTTNALNVVSTDGIYLMIKDGNGNIITEPFSSLSTTDVGKLGLETDDITLTEGGKKAKGLKTVEASTGLGLTAAQIADLNAGKYTVFVDYYITKDAGAYQIDIEPDQFGGYFYIEAATLFRDQATGVDMPAEFIIPNGKVQSNFTFTMAGSGDPSTFTFTVDAFPGRVKGGTKDVLAAIQVIEEGGIVDPKRAKTDAN